MVDGETERTGQDFVKISSTVPRGYLFSIPISSFRLACSRGSSLSLSFPPKHSIEVS